MFNEDLVKALNIHYFTGIIGQWGCDHMRGGQDMGNSSETYNVQVYEAKDCIAKYEM